MTTIQSLRESARKTPAAAANKLSLSLEAYTQIESGEIPIVYWQAKQLAGLFDCSYHEVLRDEYQRLREQLSQYLWPVIPPRKKEAGALIDDFIIEFFANDLFSNILMDFNKLVHSCSLVNLSRLALSEVPLSRMTAKLKELDEPLNGLTVSCNEVTYAVSQQELLAAIVYRVLHMFVEWKSGCTVLLVAERDYGGCVNRIAARQTFMTEAFLPAVRALMEMLDYASGCKDYDLSLAGAFLEANRFVPEWKP